MLACREKRAQRRVRQRTETPAAHLSSLTKATLYFVDTYESVLYQKTAASFTIIDSEVNENVRHSRTRNSVASPPLDYVVSCCCGSLHPYLHQVDVQLVVHHEVESDHLEELPGGPAEAAGGADHGRFLHQVHRADGRLDLRPDLLRTLTCDTRGRRGVTSAFRSPRSLVPALASHHVHRLNHVSTSCHILWSRLVTVTSVTSIMYSRPITHSSHITCLRSYHERCLVTYSRHVSSKHVLS